MTRAIVLSGQGRYEDKWHDLAGTSHAVAKALESTGLDTAVSGLAMEVLTNLEGVDLLVVNAAGGRTDPDFDGDDAAWAPARLGLTAFIEAGGSVLALHSSCYAFADNPAWYPFIGAEWIWGESTHPPIGLASIQVVSDPHAIAVGVSDFSVFDERYSKLRTHRPVRPYLTHSLDGTIYPLAWADQIGPARVVFNALGHTQATYQCPGRLKLLQREVDWLLRRL
ncbi:MAG: ThuA domain-containing protein [Bifidobacteriaceae bacterium]|jgi:hypothetical protein|nr:ThuA domain-containing protein [Bifidobacteriaceae bacterium]